jgi:A/G-specific adenine glycosylase
MKQAANDLAKTVVAWQARHGRNTLPWQNTQDPYRVWLSEIMLQQTQVVTVLDYFARFIQRFPDVQSLAAAPQDDVLGLWSGLGYYSRARNLHACAQQVVSLHGGEFPRSAQVLQTLPGIGRSTAAAIAAICFGERVAILDGNVKRVLTRVMAYGEDLAQARHERALWELASDLLPSRDLAQTMPRYTQGLMDLGAGICNSRKPQCEVCPLADMCLAHQQGNPLAYPVKTRKLKRSAQSIWLLCAATRDGKVWLSPRPVPGVWAGLYCPPLFDSFEALQAAVPVSLRTGLESGEVFKHVLTHKDLYLHPVWLTASAASLKHLPGAWVASATWPDLGLPAPVRKLLMQC